MCRRTRGARRRYSLSKNQTNRPPNAAVVKSTDGTSVYSPFTTESSTRRSTKPTARPMRVMMKHVVAIDAISAPWFAICATSTMEALVTAAPPRTDLRVATRALHRTKKHPNVSLHSGVTTLRTRTTTAPRAFAKIASAHLFTGTPATARVAESRVALRFENHPRHHVSPRPKSAYARSLSLPRRDARIHARTLVHERPARRANRLARRFIQWIGLHRAPIDVRRPRRLRSRLPRLRARRSTRRKFLRARARFHAQNRRARVDLRARARDRAIARVVASRASSRVRRRVRVVRRTG